MNYKTSLNNQAVQLSDCLIVSRKKPMSGQSVLALGWCTGMLMGMIGLSLVKSCHQEPVPAIVGNYQRDCQQCHSRKQAMVNYFKQAGSKTPEEMADAVLKSKSPRLLAAVAVVESGGNPTVRKTGYKRRHDGAYQVNSRHWGKVPHDAAGQTIQADAILQELTAEMPIKQALAVYGGDSSGTGKYGRRILAELAGVP